MWHSCARFHRGWHLIMNNGIKYLMIGNTRWHWAIKERNQWRFEHTKPNYTKFIVNKSEYIKWASVGELPADHYLHLSNQIKIEDVPLKNKPAWLGIDRALGAWGAINKAKEIGAFSQGIILADAGTVFSLTLIDSSSSFIGGQLTSGLSLNLAAMAKGTQNLTNPGLFEKIPAMSPCKTNEAMKRGALQSLIGLLTEAQMNFQMPIWLCGGDSHLIIKALNERKLNINHHPNLVLEGMTLLQ